jgi:phosphoribosylaminoimidazole-succinocarboxamide synthase
MDKKTIQGQLGHAIEKTGFSGERKENADWDMYTTEQKVNCIATDRVSVHDRFIGTVPFKGQILATCTKIMCDVVATETDVLEQPHPNVLVVKKLEDFAVSFIVYGYLTDPLWEQYNKGVRSYHGHTLPQGLQKNQKFPEAIIVPLVGGKPTSKEMVFMEGLVDEDLYEEAEELVTTLFTNALPHAEKNGLILANAQYAFGTDDAGLVLRHGFHVPGNTLYWFAEGYQEGKDPKEFMMSVIHDWLADAGWDGDGPAPPLPDELRVKAAEQYVKLSTQFIGKKVKIVVGDQVEEIEKVLE